MLHSDSEQTTLILRELCQQRPGAAERLMTHLYDELKEMAVHAMKRERSDHTLQPTALVNEAFLRLINQEQMEWQGRAHFFAVAATTMRRVLISHARKRNSIKRGGKDSCRIPLHDELCTADGEPDIDILMLNDLLEELEQLHARHARIIELRFFAGLSISEAAIALGVSDWTVKNDWRTARAWLLSRLDQNPPTP